MSNFVSADVCGRDGQGRATHHGVVELASDKTDVSGISRSALIPQAKKCIPVVVPGNLHTHMP